MNKDGFIHDFVRHAETYLNGAIHTNGIENFWTLLKRCIYGTHVSIEPSYTFRYLHEEAFRFNERCGQDQDRFMLALFGIVGKRLTYKEATGNDEAPIAGGPHQSKAPAAREASEGMRKPKEFQRFEDLVKRVLAVPKAEIDRRDAEYKESRKGTRPPKRKPLET